MPTLTFTPAQTKIDSLVCALLAGTIGAIGLAGWIFHIPALQRIHPALVTMKANTAISLILASVSLLLLQNEKVTGFKRLLAQFFAALIMLVGLMTLGEIIFGWDLGIDQFFFHEPLATSGRSVPGRMGVASCLVFILLGAALMFLDVRLAGRYWAPKFAVAAAVATTLVFLYYFFGIEQGEAISKYATIALHTVVAFYALCMGIFFVRPDRGVMRELLGPGVGSVVARRLLPAAFFLPILLGWLRTLGQNAGLYGMGFGTAAFVLSIILLFGALIRWTVIAINRQEGERKRAEVGQSRLAAIVMSCNDAIISKSLDGTITSWNPGAEKTFGYTAEEMIGQSILRLIPPNRQGEEADIVARIETGEPINHYETERITKDGRRLPVSLTISPIKNATGNIIGASKIVRDITERKEAETTIKKSEERFRALVTTTSDVIYCMNRDWSQMLWLDGRDFIMNTEKPRLTWLEEYIMPEDQPRVMEAIQEAIQAKSIFELEHQVQRVDGTFGWTFSRAIPLLDAKGEIIEWFGTLCDETVRKQAEESLRESENFKSAILNSALDAIITMDHEGKVVSFNPGAERTFGFRQEEMIGQVMADKIIPVRLRERHNQGLAHYLLSGEGPVLNKRIEVPALHADGHEFHIELSINRIVNLEPPIFTATMRDITSRLLAETALRESEERFRTLADNMSQLAWMSDADGALFWYNQRWFDYTGTTLEQMQGWGWEKVNHPDHLPRIIENWTQHLKSGTDFEDTFPLRGTDGRYRWFLTRAVPIRDADGKVQRWFGTNTDVTDQREAADALSRAKEQAEAASRAKDDFLAALSHELRTPLTPVLMMATALGEDAALPLRVREQLAMMRRNIELEARLIDDLLDLTRISHGKLVITPTVTDVHELLDHTAEIILSDRLGKEVRIDFIPEAARHHTLADATRLQQVFWNLIKNAIKFTPSGGNITVSTSNDAEGQIILTVTDSGVGISAEALPHIFAAFEQGDIAGQHRYGGLGLGLAISKAIMDAHGGTIAVASAGQGHGATFTIALASVDAPTGLNTGLGTGAGPRQLRLLIVEDHETTRIVMAKLLTRRGHHVTTASTVQEGLSAYAASHFDGVISDLGLPDGSGLELMREIQRHRPVPAIALSGYGMEDDVRRTREAGFFAHLVKPVNLDQLRQLIDQITPSAMQNHGTTMK